MDLGFNEILLRIETNRFRAIHVQKTQPPYTVDKLCLYEHPNENALQAAICRIYIKTCDFKASKTINTKGFVLYIFNILTNKFISNFDITFTRF